MEHVITAYKYGTFMKIPEFMSFRDQLLNSCQYYMVAVEKRFLEFYFASPSDFTQVCDMFMQKPSRLKFKLKVYKSINFCNRLQRLYKTKFQEMKCLTGQFLLLTIEISPFFNFWRASRD